MIESFAATGPRVAVIPQTLGVPFHPVAMILPTDHAHMRHVRFHSVVDGLALTMQDAATACPDIRPIDAVADNREITDNRPQDPIAAARVLQEHGVATGAIILELGSP